MGKSNKPEKDVQQYLKYSGIAVQMIISILGLGWLGVQIDKATHFNYSIGALVGMLLGVFISIYLLIKQLAKK